MAAKTSWHRYGTKLRRCHHMCRRTVRVFQMMMMMMMMMNIIQYDGHYCSKM